VDGVSLLIGEVAVERDPIVTRSQDQSGAVRQCETRGREGRRPVVLRRFRAPVPLTVTLVAFRVPPPVTVRGASTFRWRRPADGAGQSAVAGPIQLLTARIS
jgi:hypothetical protein